MLIFLSEVVAQVVAGAPQHRSRRNVLPGDGDAACRIDQTPDATKPALGGNAVHLRFVTI
jgi:hypothetical protein